MTQLSRAVIACISAIMILPDAASIAGADTFTQYHDLLHLHISKRCKQKKTRSPKEGGGGESFFALGSRGFRESLDVGHSYVQQGIELGPNLIFLGAGHMAKRAFLLRSHFGSWSFWLMMIEIVVPP